MSSISQHYQLSEEQMLEIYQTILSLTEHGFSYIKNQIPSYKGDDGKWHSLVDKDPYDLAEECKIDLTSISLKLTDLEGLSVLADQRLFLSRVTPLLDAHSHVLSQSQRARQLANDLTQNGLKWGGRTSLSDALDQAMNSTQKDPFLLMKKIALSGKWLFDKHYSNREQIRLRREDAYDIKRGSYCLNASAKSRLADHAAGIMESVSPHPIYFIEKFHHVCARQGLAISLFVDDGSPEILSNQVRQHLNKAYKHAVEKDWEAFDRAIMALEYRFTDRLPTYNAGHNALASIRKSLASTPWAVLEHPPKEQTEFIADVDRQMLIKQLALKDHVGLFYDVLYEMTKDVPEEQARLREHWNGVFSDIDLKPAHEWDVNTVSQSLSKAQSHFLPYVSKMRRVLEERALGAIQEHLGQSSALKPVLLSQVSMITNAEKGDCSLHDLGLIKLFQKALSVDNIKQWACNDTPKRAADMSNAFVQQASLCKVSGVLGLDLTHPSLTGSASMKIKK